MVETKLIEELRRIAGDGKGGFVITHGSEMPVACLAVFIESLLRGEREKEKRLWMLSLVHLDTKTRENILNTYAELESLKHE